MKTFFFFFLNTNIIEPNCAWMVIRWSLTMDIFMWGGSPYEKKVRQLMVNNSTNINKTNYHLKSLNTKRPRQMTCDIDNLSLEQAEKCSMVKLVMGSQHPLLIIGYPMAIQKCTDLNEQYKICTGLLSLKNPHTSIITKMNNDVNMDSTIAGSMNANS